MKTKKELQKLSKAIDSATAKYNIAVFENLKECANKEFTVNSEYDESLVLTVDSLNGDDDTVDITVDKIRYNSKNNHVEIHVCELEYKDCDEWYESCFFGYDILPFIYDGIVW